MEIFDFYCYFLIVISLDREIPQIGLAIKAKLNPWRKSVTWTPNQKFCPTAKLTSCEILYT